MNKRVWIQDIDQKWAMFDDLAALRRQYGPGLFDEQKNKGYKSKHYSASSLTDNISPMLKFAIPDPSGHDIMMGAAMAQNKEKRRNRK